jgi:hypothetical protein
VVPRLLKRERPGGRLLVLEETAQGDQPIMISEFGGICASEDENVWGYSRAAGSGELAERYRELLAVVSSLQLLSGFCYTQLTDTYQEANGLLHADRTPKFPLEDIAAATRGERRPPKFQMRGETPLAGTRHEPTAPPFDDDY